MSRLLAQRRIGPKRCCRVGVIRRADCRVSDLHLERVFAHGGSIKTNGVGSLLVRVDVGFRGRLRGAHRALLGACGWRHAGPPTPAKGYKHSATLHTALTMSPSIPCHSLMSASIWMLTGQGIMQS